MSVSPPAAAALAIAKIAIAFRPRLLSFKSSLLSGAAARRGKPYYIGCAAAGRTLRPPRYDASWEKRAGASGAVGKLCFAHGQSMNAKQALSGSKCRPWAEQSL
ncbi:MAG TPA: hypothetical protein VGB99_12385, partial [Acidobacteriota bacterium]